MSNKFRSVLKVALVSAALVAGPLAWADGGIAGKVAGKVREQTREANESRKEQSRNESRSESRPAQRSESRGGNRGQSRAQERRAPRPEPRAEPAQPDKPGVVRRTTQTGQPAAAQPQRNSHPVPAPQQNNARGSERSPDRGLTGSLVQREYQTSRGGDRGNGNGNGGGRGGDRDHDNGNDRGNDRGNNGRDWGRDYSDHRDNDWYRDRRPGRVVQRLPGGYRDYSWNGGRYYYYSGNWYRPYGTSYISIGIPYGLFVTSLPGAYSSIWFGGTRYFYSDYNYYVYEPARRGYVVAPSPYGDDEYDYEDSRLDEDLYIYPARGQSEQQQADDRYECHRWAVRESDYDPIDDEYDADLRGDYLRAMTACLDGRGYTVR